MEGALDPPKFANLLGPESGVDFSRHLPDGTHSHSVDFGRASVDFGRNARVHIAMKINDLRSYPEDFGRDIFKYKI